MPNTPFNQRVSVALLLAADPPYELSAFGAAVQATIDQDIPVETIVVDDRGADAQPDFLPARVDAAQVRHLPGSYANRAAMCNAALGATQGDYLLLVQTDRLDVRLQSSAAQTMLMSAVRRAGERPVGLVYADYERIEPDGQRREVHLLDWHAGRFCDTLDLGQAWLLSVAALRELGGFDEQYGVAELYDLRLRLSERYGLAHIANRFAGSLYSVAAPAAAHNVFAYLLADRQTQIEMEQACTEHLRRSDVYLTPDAHVQTVAYTPDEQQRFADCLATIVTPVNNRPEFIGRAIESVQAQTVQAVEMIVVVNGGPNDPTADEVRRYMPGGDRHAGDKPPVRLIVVDINNLGLCLNTGIRAANGKYYVQLDSDDRLKPDAVEKLLAVFDSDPTIGMVIGSYEVWTLDEQSGELHRNEDVPVVTHAEWTADNGRNNLLRIGGAGAPRSAHIKAIADVGWFGVNDTPSCRNYGEDYDLVLRMSERHTIGRVWEPIYEVIRHSGGTDHSIDQAAIDRNEDAKDQMRLEALERRRALNLNR